MQRPSIYPRGRDAQRAHNPFAPAGDLRTPFHTDPSFTTVEQVETGTPLRDTPLSPPPIPGAPDATTTDTQPVALSPGSTTGLSSAQLRALGMGGGTSTINTGVGRTGASAANDAQTCNAAYATFLSAHPEYRAPVPASGQASAAEMITPAGKTAFLAANPGCASWVAAGMPMPAMGEATPPPRGTTNGSVPGAPVSRLGAIRQAWDEAPVRTKLIAVGIGGVIVGAAAAQILNRLNRQ